MRYLTAICTLILLSVTGFGTDGKDVRHFEVNVIACDKLVLEGFDLGEVTVGEKIKLQLYMRNLTSTRLKLSSLMQEGSDVKFHSNDTIIEPQHGAILQATVDIPVSPSELKKTFQLSGSLSPNCEFGFLFKSTILGATCFAKKEWICEFEDSQAGGKVEVIIPLLLSNPADYAKLRARCDDSISFLTVEVTRIDDKPVLRATFYPRAHDRQRFRGQIINRN